MFLKKLELTNFRNFPKAVFDFSKLNIISGPNGKGKTNILEAIYLLSSTKSFRSTKNSDLVLWGKDFSRISSQVSSDLRELNISLILDLRPQRIQPKTIKIDNRARKLFYALGKLKTVLFSPESLNIILGAPNLRRRFLDFLISQQDTKYAKYLLFLTRVLKNRNLVLARINQGQANLEELDFWTNELVNYGSLIILRRSQMIKYFNQIMPEKFQEISGKNQNLSMEYKSKITNQWKTLLTLSIKQIKKEFLNQLNQEIEKEKYFQKTIIGPHRDNLIFKLDNKNIEHFGSRGEIRSAILALKLSEVDFLSQKNSGDPPLFLLDDVFSELDRDRKEYLSKMLFQVQTIITACDSRTVPVVLREKAKVFRL